MMDFVSRLNGGELIGIVAVIGGLLIAMVGTIAGSWVKVRRAEIAAALKQDMLNRGLSADEIRTVLEAGSKGAAKGPQG